MINFFGKELRNADSWRRKKWTTRTRFPPSNIKLKKLYLHPKKRELYSDTFTLSATLPLPSGLLSLSWMRWPLTRIFLWARVLHGASRDYAPTRHSLMPEAGQIPHCAHTTITAELVQAELEVGQSWWTQIKNHYQLIYYYRLQRPQCLSLFVIFVDIIHRKME